jgi:siroheme synthase
MAGAQAAEICKTLIRAGMSGDTPICIVESASRKGIRLKSTLTAVARDGLATYIGPVSLLIGQALALAQIKETIPLSSDCVAVAIKKAIPTPDAFDLAFG